jgi:hypothetical protein
VPTTITLLSNRIDGSGSNLLYALGTIAFSGSYPGSAGDTLDFTTVADKLSSTTVLQAFAEGVASAAYGAAGGYFTIQQGTALNNWKIRVFAAGGAELTAAAYPSNILNDTVQLTLTLAKLS